MKKERTNRQDTHPVSTIPEDSYLFAKFETNVPGVDHPVQVEVWKDGKPPPKSTQEEGGRKESL